MSHPSAFRRYALLFGLLALALAAYLVKTVLWPAPLWPCRETYTGLRWSETEEETAPCVLTLEGKRSLSGSFSGTVILEVEGEEPVVREDCDGTGGPGQWAFTRLRRTEAPSGKADTSFQAVGHLITGGEEDGFFTFAFFEEDPAYGAGTFYSGPAETREEAQGADRLARERS